MGFCCKAIDKTDWKQLKGRKVVLWADNDQVGHDAMQRLAQKLYEIGVEYVKQIKPPDNEKKGWDLADASWTTKEAAVYAKNNIYDIQQTSPVVDLLPTVETEVDVEDDVNVDVEA